MKVMPRALEDLIALRGLTQTDVWAAAGLSSSTMTRWLNGERGRELNDKSLTTLRKLSDTLGVPLTYWLEFRLYQLGQIARADGELIDNAYISVTEIARKRGIPFDEGTDHPG